MPLSNLFVSVHTAAQPLLRVIDVKTGHRVKPDCPVKVADDLVVSFSGTDIIACRKEMTGIKAGFDPVLIPHAVSNLPEVFKAIADVGPLSGSGPTSAIALNTS